MKLTYRETNALRNLGQRLHEKLQLDEYAPLADWPEESFAQHLDGVRALEAIDILCGKPKDRDYDQLKWSASSSIAKIREEDDGEQKVLDAIRMSSRQDNEI